jgi:hypothetical protein
MAFPTQGDQVARMIIGMGLMHLNIGSVVIAISVMDDHSSRGVTKATRLSITFKDSDSKGS